VAADLVVGTSAGALNAAFVASRPQTPATANELARVWRGLQREDIFPVSVARRRRRTLRNARPPRAGRELRRLVGRYIEFEDLSDAAVPLHVVAFDVNEGREVLLSHGPRSMRSRRPPRSRASSRRVDRRAASDRRWRRQQHPDLTRGRARRGAHLRPPDPAAGAVRSACAAPRSRCRDLRLGVLVDAKLKADVAVTRTR